MYIMHYTISFKNPDNKENSLQFGAQCTPSKTLTTRKIPDNWCTYIIIHNVYYVHHIPSPSKTLTTRKILDNWCTIRICTITMYIMCTIPSPSKTLTTRKIPDNLVHVYIMCKRVEYHKFVSSCTSM